MPTTTGGLFGSSSSLNTNQVNTPLFGPKTTQPTTQNKPMTSEIPKFSLTSNTNAPIGGLFGNK